MDYSFDEIFVKNDIIYVNGWATAENKENEIRFSVVDSKNQPVDCKIIRGRRTDVSFIKYGDPKAGMVGVFIEVPRSGKKVVSLVLEELSSETQKVISTKKVLLNLHTISLRMAYKKMKQKLAPVKKKVKKIQRKLLSLDEKEYMNWRREMCATKEELQIQRTAKFPLEPQISIVVPMFCTKVNYINDMISSVWEQTYGNWELCLVNASPQETAMRECIEQWKEKDSRIHSIDVSNDGIAENTNAGVSMAKGEFIAFLDHDDFLEPNTLFEYVKALNEHPETDLFYSDEDKVNERGTVFYDPYFKSDFNMDLLHCNNYMCHFRMVRTSLLKEVGGENSAMDGAQDYDFILRCVEKTKHICHIDFPLYHWRSTSSSTAASQKNKEYAFEAGKKALEEHFARLLVKAKVELGSLPGTYRVVYELEHHPKVSFIIPNKDHIQDLDVCLRSLFEKCTYDNFEVVVVENNSTEEETFKYYKQAEEKWKNQLKVIDWKGIFNYSAINNFGIQFTTGEYIVLLNNDVEVISPNLIESMLGYCMRPEVGIVGAKLLYSDGTVQHGGVIVGAGGVADHIFKNMKENEPGYMGRAVCSQDLSAVTAACMMVKKTVYEEVGGLDELFEVAFNDVDFCLKVRQKGYLVVMDVDAKLFHYESKSRGTENTSEKFFRFSDEMYHFNEKWHIYGDFRDPYYGSHMSYIDQYFVLNKDEKKRK